MQETEDGKGPVSTASDGFDVSLVPGLSGLCYYLIKALGHLNTIFEIVELLNADDYGLRQSGSSTGEEDDDDGEGRLESETLKLTRAQRKRLRRKKLKEDISRRGKIIGPLPLSSNDGEGGCSSAVKERSPAVRENADEDDSHLSAAASNNPG